MVGTRFNGAEYVLCAAIYIDTGVAEPPRRSYAYPATGLVFAGWRHGDCFTSLDAWSAGLSYFQVGEIERIDKHQLHGSRQGFLTSTGRFVDRKEGWRLAVAAGQVEPSEGRESLNSEDLY